MQIGPKHGNIFLSYEGVGEVFDTHRREEGILTMGKILA